MLIRNTNDDVNDDMDKMTYLLKTLHFIDKLAFAYGRGKFK